MPREFNLCLIGGDVASSPSAAMQEAALRAAGLRGRYDLIGIEAAGLPGVLHDLRARRWRGANVTIPYKIALASVCDLLEGDAQRTGAVNTIVVEAGGRLVGDNTDAHGFEMGLNAARLLPPPGHRAIVIGAGGVACAVVLALSRVPASRITVVARHVAGARALIERLGELEGCELTTGLWDEDYLERELATADIIVNATPVGLPEMPFIPARLPPSCTVADVRYRPRPVDLVDASLAAGLRSCDGFEMMLHQGMLSFHRWTGAEPPYHAARLALSEALAA
jgi:shikimate dehydrogenase